MPLVSVIIPTYNRPTYIEAVLATLRWQTLRDFEVIISDDGGKPDTYGIVRRFSTDLDLKYIWQRDKSWNQPEAKNLGMKLARGEILFLSDDYIFYPPKCLARHVKTHCTSKERIMIYGLKQYHPDLKPGQVVKYLKTSFPKGCTRSFLSQPPAQKNFSIKRNEIYAINGYDQDFCGGWGYDDIDFDSRLKRNGVKTINARDIPSLGIKHTPIRAKDRSRNLGIYKRKKGHIVCCNGLFDRRSVSRK